MPDPNVHMAIDCLWLRRTIDSSQKQNPFQTLCSHIIRDGKDCVGPFLEQMETPCLLWEPNARLRQSLAAAAEAERR
ncbi:MAG: hypothetical protein IT299_03650 [Dehalococcoidia bacterium]|nr:hypothetical protein [Dehalococcoidia bacterium]